MGRQSEHGRLHVLLVAGQVNECDELRGGLTDLLSTDTRGVVDNLK